MTFLRIAMNDIHAGRETWRVRALLTVPAFMMAVAFAIARLP